MPSAVSVVKYLAGSLFQSRQHLGK